MIHDVMPFMLAEILVDAPPTASLSWPRRHRTVWVLAIAAIAAMLGIGFTLGVWLVS